MNGLKWVGQWLIAGFVLVGTAVEAHECRKIGDTIGFGNMAKHETPAYWVCVGFHYEDGFKPAAGLTENIDFLTAFYDPKLDNGVDSDGKPIPPGGFRDIGLEAGDDVSITAKLFYLNSTTWEYWDTTTDKDNWLIIDPPKSAHVGWDSPVALDANGNVLFQKTLLPQDFKIPKQSDEGVLWTGKKDWVIPYKGMYAWVIEGKLKKQGKKPVYFSTKFTCGIPRDRTYTTNPTTGQVYPSDRGFSNQGIFDCANHKKGDPVPMAPFSASNSDGDMTFKKLKTLIDQGVIQP